MIREGITLSGGYRAIGKSNNNIFYVLIRGGEFTMGSPLGEVDRRSWGSDGTQYQVIVSDFYMGKYAVTVAEFKKFVEASGYHTDADKADNSVIGNRKAKMAEGVNWRYGVSGMVRPLSEENHPVVHASWNDAVAYCKWLSAITDKRFYLPTEAEWEYACRAGSRTPFNTGENLTTKQANYDGNYPYNNNPKGVCRQNTVAVNSFFPNSWGLYNMHGNVDEWCSDWYGASYYDECKANGTVTNPAGPETGSYRVLRGGGWRSGAEYCRSAGRICTSPDNQNHDIGFRLVFVP